MIALIVLAVVELIVIIMIVNKCNRLRLEQVLTEATYEFSNSTVRQDYNKLATFLRTRKSKLSLDSKIYVLDGWYSILLALPNEVKEHIIIQPDSIDVKNDELTITEHKKAVIDALEQLAEIDNLEFNDYKLLSTISYHIMFLVINTQ